MKRFTRLAILLGGLATCSACIGRFRATSAVWEWNKSVSQNKFAREVVFLALNIIPVYEVTVFLIDPFVLNVIDFWTTGQVATGTTAPDGTRLASAVVAPDTLRVTCTQGGVVLSSVDIVKVGEGAAVVRDASGRIVASVERLPDGQVVTR